MLNVAILGAGIGAQHLAAYQALPHLFRVVALVDKDQTRAEALRGTHDFLITPDWNGVFARPDIDLIDICLPPHLHLPVTLEALAAGKNAICEKPLATSLAGVEQIAQTAKRHNRKVYPVFQYRWGRSCAQLRHLQRADLLGQPLVAALETHWSRDSTYYDVPWRGTWAGEQGGAVLGHAIHAHDLLTHFMGPVRAVSAVTTTRVNPIETEDCAALTFEMANGALATSNITLGAATDETRLRFVFEKLTVTSGSNPYAPGTSDWSFMARDPNDQPDIDHALTKTPDEASGFTGFLAAIADDLAGRPSGAVSLADGAASIELVSAVYHSARSGARVSLPLSSAHPLFNGWIP
ncbi:gfo/Idh/MocA family oxidoreductase [Roseobacter denitrificans]|uniref:Oxidoreductase, putative n=1 Tax=Roseobacter denitrificans (strain ATCC 33942 / OCh 114) TaxID=375451 RepID=Q16CC9_ROSDO|nr:Gfo/Idh/MocA family oxidoreductase [Roseobacter denitrificans]ABG30364.1 oxidoreductase, putative [Roseobacter denitrificans OCh 114]AVL53525.1 gfo/Idh/MocA family oxidoreductase [Roseobacter denitrificans]SFF71989.1 Predicted dehydrogenase [Roseobacter denitrificans OCh 114]